jgi:chromosome segregation ATPase
LQRDEREIKGAIDKSKRKIKDYENSIQAEIQRLEQQNGGSSTRLKEEKAEVEAERDRLITQISVLDEQNIADKQAYQDAVDQLRQAKARQDAKQSELEGAKELLHKLRQADRNVMGAFDPKTQNLLAEIERQRNKFKELPVGPLGLHVTLRDPKWMSIVERFFWLHSDCIRGYKSRGWKSSQVYDG